MANVNDVLSSSSITTNTAITGKGVEDLSMDDFFKLLMAEMTNQDIFSSTDGGSSSSSSSNMLSQMSQFSTMQGLKNIQEYQQSSYATSYVGKDVTIANVNEDTGQMETIKGTVEAITFYDGQPQVVVNGKSYALHTVMEINNPSNTGNALNQASGYIGKMVTLTDTDEEGFPFDVTGIVESVTIKGGKPYVTVGGKDYPTNSITDVTSASSAEEEDEETETSEETDNSNLDTDEE